MSDSNYKWRTDFSWKDHCLAEAKALPITKRQEFMDYMVKEHLCLGDAYKKAMISFDQANGIMMMQIKESTYLETTIRE